MTISSIYENIPADPPIINDRGKAWVIEPLSGALVANWLVCAEDFSNPMWWWYLITCTHLRPITDTPLPTIRKEGATHELTFLALDPTKPLPDIKNWPEGGIAVLEPIDLVHQFIVRSDKQAQQLTQAIVRHICQGNSPDVDYRLAWQDIVDSSAEHICYGTHPSRN